MTSRSLGHRAPLLWLVLPFIGGLAAAELGVRVTPWATLAVALLAAGISIFAAWRAPKAWNAAVVTAMACAGVAAYGLHHRRPPEWATLPPREAHLALRIERVFPQKDARKTAGLATVVSADDSVRELKGLRVYFSLTLAKGASEPMRSAIFDTTGIVAALPDDSPPASFESYLAAAGVEFRLTRGRLGAEKQPATAYYRFCARVAEKFKTILATGIATKRPELSALLRAMMLGETHELSSEQREVFMESGTMHLFAISGLNIAVIAGALQALLLPTRLPPWARFAIGTALLWLFVDITGAAPSAVRAFGMAAIVQAALLLWRPINPLAGLTASALVVLLLAPLQVFSASFQMSYGIVAALLLLGLPLTDALLEKWSPWRDLPKPTWAWWQHALDAAWRWTAAALAIGVATMLVGLITGVQFFQLMTPGSLFANLALIPAAMLVTVGGFLSLLCGLVGWSVGAALMNHAAALVLLAIERLVQWSVKVPGAFHHATFRAPWIGGAALAGLTAVLLIGYATGWRRRRVGWWSPFAVVAVVVIFGVKFG